MSYDELSSTSTSARQCASRSEGSCSASSRSSRSGQSPRPTSSHPGPVETWRARPLVLRVACGPRAGAQESYNYPNTMFPIETDHFVGHMYFRFRNLDGEPTEYFAGRERKLSAVVQGRVKHPIVMSSCVTGYEFDQPFQNVPATWLISAAMRFVRRIAPTIVVDILGRQPYILNPLFQTVQLLHVAQPGGEPPMTSVMPMPETTHLLGGIFAQKPLDRLQVTAIERHPIAFWLPSSHLG